MTARRAERRLMARPEAAQYCGVSLPVFDDLRQRGLVPRPLKWPGVSKMLFDTKALDEAIDALAEPVEQPKEDWAMS